MGKNVAVFVDVANIFYAAKAAGVDIDYVTLLKSATAGRDLVRAYAYTGLDPDNENQRNFHDFLRRSNYKVVSKDIRKYGDGKVKANLDIELVVDLMKTARNLDIAIVISGDGDFAPAIRAVQEMGVRVEVISFRGNTSSDLIEVADLFTDITQLARVDKTSSRSGRRVAGDQEDLSMTEVPDKQTEGTGQRGRGGRGRGRGRAGEAEPVAASAARRTSSRTSGRDASPIAAVVAAPVAAASGNGALTVLPGEKLSRVGAAAAPAAGPVEELDDDELTPFDAAAPAEAVAADDGSGDGPEGEGEGDAKRRRRRRGGRGRGRGRGRDGEALPVGEGDVGAGPIELDDDVDHEEDEEDDVIVAPPAAPRGPRTTPFGSVWDSQIGTPTSAPASLGPVADDEDFEEPEIPEYLIAEQRRGQQGGRAGQGNRGGGPRGGRAAYTAAIDRERYGRGGGGGGINRYPDVSGGQQVSDRERQIQGGGSGRSSGGAQRQGGQGGNYARQDASYSRGSGGDRAERPSAPRSGDPWSEVPPELEEMLRAQLAQSPKGRRPAPSPSSIEAAGAAGEIETMTESAVANTIAVETTAPKRRASTRRTAAPAAEAVEAMTAAPADDAPTADSDAPKRRATRKKADASATVPAEGAPSASSDESTVADAAAPKRRTTRKKVDADTGSAEGAVASADAAPADDAAAPKRRATRKKAEPA